MKEHRYINVAGNVKSAAKKGRLKIFHHHECYIFELLVLLAYLPEIFQPIIMRETYDSALKLSDDVCYFSHSFINFVLLWYFFISPFFGLPSTYALFSPFPLLVKSSQMCDKRLEKEQTACLHSSPPRAAELLGFHQERTIITLHARMRLNALN